MRTIWARWITYQNADGTFWRGDPYWRDPYVAIARTKQEIRDLRPDEGPPVPWQADAPGDGIVEAWPVFDGRVFHLLVFDPEDLPVAPDDRERVWTFLERGFPPGVIFAKEPKTEDEVKSN